MIAFAPREDWFGRERIVAVAEGVGIFKFCALALATLTLAEIIWSVGRPWAVDYDADAGFLIAGWMWSQGFPLYHAPDSAQRYSLLYGPAAFVLFGGLLGATKQLLAVKIMAVGLLGGAVALTARAISQVALGRWTVWLVAVLGLQFLAICGKVGISPRGDVLLLFLAAVGLHAAIGGRVLVLGLLAGLALAVKPSALLYFVPLAAIVMPKCRAPVRSMLAAAGLAAMAWGSFFLVRGIDATQYVYWTLAAARHPLKWGNAAACMGLALVAAAPLWLALSLRRFGEDRDKWPRLALGAAAAGLCVVGAKLGAGPYHLLPLLPVYLWLLAMAFGPMEVPLMLSRATHAPALALAVAAFTLPAILLQIVNGAVVANTVLGVPQKVDSTALADIRRALDAYGREGVAMAYGELSHRSVNGAIYLATHGGRVLLTDVAQWDMAAAGIAIPATTIAQIESGDIRYWLIPGRDVPFASESLYDRSDYLAPVRAAFLRTCRYDASLNAFALWRCDHPQDMAAHP